MSSQVFDFHSVQMLAQEISCAIRDGLLDENGQRMTLRDRFAAEALAGLLPNLAEFTTATDVAKYAYKYADAMIAARNLKP